MKLITRQSKANEVSEEFKERYFSKSNGAWMTPFKWAPDGTEALYDAVVAANGDIPQIDKLLPGWCDNTGCSECGEKADVVQLGETQDDESETAWVCKACLLAALALFEPLPPTPQEDNLVSDEGFPLREIAEPPGLTSDLIQWSAWTRDSRWGHDEKGWSAHGRCGSSSLSIYAFPSAVWYEIVTPTQKSYQTMLSVSDCLKVCEASADAVTTTSPTDKLPSQS
jgi:hypothetical protein